MRLHVIRLLFIGAAIAGATSGPAQAQQPAWWIQQKQNCGLPAGMAYNDWLKNPVCNGSGGGGPRPPTMNNMQKALTPMIQQGIQAILDEAARAEAARKQAAIERQAETDRQAAVALEAARNQSEASKTRLLATLKPVGSAGTLQLKSVDQAAPVAPPPNGQVAVRLGGVAPATLGASALPTSGAPKTGGPSGTLSQLGAVKQQGTVTATIKDPSCFDSACAGVTPTLEHPPVTPDATPVAVPPATPPNPQAQIADLTAKRNDIQMQINQIQSKPQQTPEDKVQLQQLNQNFQTVQAQIDHPPAPATQPTSPAGQPVAPAATNVPPPATTPPAPTFTLVP